jgi:serine/threonine-protein kinase
LWIPEISRFVIEGIFLSFFAVFPCRLFRARWPWFVIWVPVLATLPWRISEFYSKIYRPRLASPVAGWLPQIINLRAMVYLAAGVMMLVVAYRRLANLNEKRRVRVLMVGTAISLVTAIPVVWYFNSVGYWLKPWVSMVIGLLIPATLACPLAFAYAILRHRVLDIQVIIRQSLRYALARGAVLGVVPVLGGILVLDLAVNREEPLAHILQARGWVYAALGGLALLAYWRRQPWLEALDRRFFRERYNAQRLLREVAGEIREGGGLDRVSPRVVARIESALHPEFASLMVREPGEPSYRALASVPAGQAPAPLPADSKIIALARVLGKPLETLLADSGWLDQRLPHEEIDSVRRARIDLLVPVASAPGCPEALLVLGIKRSEEPYTREDQELLEAIAASLGLRLDQMAIPAEHSTGTFEECPQCGTCYDTGVARCAQESTRLVPIHMPRTLAGRYRLERRRGRGGMGSVYEATDSALERRVAVKVIREDRLGGPEVAQRFHREARAAAAFAHPNVVTVYDYGVEAGTRAFLVMELLEGATLREELKSRKRLAASRAVEIFRGVCSAVEAAHRRQLIHRDLKPENIFLARSGDGGSEVVKVLDFGIAKFLPASEDEAETQTLAETDAGVLVGTPGYMSPEQLLGERPAVSWDLWALAVTVYETLTGSLTFPVASRDKWRQLVLAGERTPLSEHLTEPPAPWEEFFARSLAADRTRRPQSAAEFFRQLEQALAWPIPPSSPL